jgi:hypothetical protein
LLKLKACFAFLATPFAVDLTNGDLPIPKMLRTGTSVVKNGTAGDPGGSLSKDDAQMSDYIEF